PNVTRWSALSNYLEVAHDLVRQMRKGVAVVVLVGSDQCSAILLGLIQLLLSPVYRSSNGFIALFAKEFARAPVADVLAVDMWHEAWAFLAITNSLVLEQPKEFGFGAEFVLALHDRMYTSG